MLIRVLYISSIGEGVSASEIDRLVASARRRNRQLDVTGALLVCDGRFAQVLEGQEILVEELMRKIALDRRHHDVLVRERRSIARRLFADWDLAFIDESRCEQWFLALRDGTLVPDAFMAAMSAWVEEQKAAPR